MPNLNVIGSCCAFNVSKTRTECSTTLPAVDPTFGSQSDNLLSISFFLKTSFDRGRLAKSENWRYTSFQGLGSTSNLPLDPSAARASSTRGRDKPVIFIGTIALPVDVAQWCLRTIKHTKQQCIFCGVLTSERAVYILELDRVGTYPNHMEASLTFFLGQDAGRWQLSNSSSSSSEVPIALGLKTVGKRSAIKMQLE